jgi:hypothetical protein
MKYPQAYLVIHKDFVMPPLETFKAWVQPCQDFYSPSLSEPNNELNEKISVILESHTYFKSKWSRDDQLIILMSEDIPKFLLLGLGVNILGIYWVNNEDCLTKLSKVNNAIYKYEAFKELYEEAFDEFSGVQEIISTMNCDNDMLTYISSDFKDNIQDMIFYYHFNQSYLEFSDVFKGMIKTLTHADDLGPHDL